MMRLSDWTLQFDEQHSSDGTLASINCCRGRKYATIRLCYDFDQKCGEEQRHTIVHELVHCHLAQLWHHVDPDDEDEAVTLLGEYAVDGLADAIAPLILTPSEFAATE